MRKVTIGLVVGITVALLDIMPMIIQSLPWTATVSALLMWVIVGLFIAISQIKLNPIVKGMLIAILVLLPSAPLIGENDLNVLLVPILPTTLVLGALSGWLINKLIKKYA